jgi:anti-anti-sigma regulatory factor
MGWGLATDYHGTTELRIVVVRRPGLRLLRVSGELDMLAAPVLKPAILVVDLTELEFLGAAGMSVLLATREFGAQLGCDVLLSATRGGIVARVLRLSGWALPGPEGPSVPNAIPALLLHVRATPGSIRTSTSSGPRATRCTTSCAIWFSAAGRWLW